MQLYLKNCIFYLLRQSMTLHVLQAVFQEKVKKGNLEQQRQQAYAILLPPMADVFHCLRFYLLMNAYLIVNIVLTVPVMMFQGHLLHLMKYASLQWNFIEEII